MIKFQVSSFNDAHLEYLSDANDRKYWYIQMKHPNDMVVTLGSCDGTILIELRIKITMQKPKMTWW